MNHVTSRHELHIHMPVYNTSPDSLQRAVDAVVDDMDESGVDRYELVIADDGSTNQATVELLDNLSYQPNVQLLRAAKNLGVGVCRQELLTYSLEAGCFAIASRDSDDISTIGSARSQLNVLGGELDVVGGAMTIVESDGKERFRVNAIEHDDLVAGLRRGLIPCFNPTLMVKNSATLKDVGYPANRYSEDIFFQARLVAAGLRIGNIKQEVCSYIRHDQSLSSGLGSSISRARQVTGTARAIWAMSPDLEPSLSDQAFVLLRAGAKVVPSRLHYAMSKLLYG